MKILFICGNGVSSGMIAMRNQQAGKKEGDDTATEAYSYAELSEVIDDYDAVLAAPQLKFQESFIRETCQEYGKPYAFISDMDYSTLNGVACFAQAKKLIEG